MTDEIAPVTIYSCKFHLLRIGPKVTCFRDKNSCFNLKCQFFVLVVSRILYQISDLGIKYLDWKALSKFQYFVQVGT